MAEATPSASRRAWIAFVTLSTTPIAAQLVWESVMYYWRVARFFTSAAPRTRCELQVWTLLYPVWVSYRGNTGYAGLTPAARLAVYSEECPGEAWDGEFEEHENSISIKRRLTMLGHAWAIPLARPALMVATFAWPLIAPFWATSSACAFLNTWLVLLRRPDLAVMTRTMRQQFGREPQLSEAEAMNTESLHVGVESKLRDLDRATYDLVAHKPSLVAALGAAGVPVARTVALGEGAIAAAAEVPLPWFAKPPRDAYGTDCRAVRTPAEAARLVPGRDFVQERLRNHPSLVPALGETTATLRIFTGNSYPALKGEVTFIDACMQVPLPGRDVSNVSAGNLGVEIDLETGRLGRGAQFDKQAAFMPPLTETSVPGGSGVPFEGLELPDLSEALEVCLRGHREVLWRACYLGWDVALTPDGPVVIECNTFCSTGVFGACLKRLKNGKLADLLLTHIENRHTWLK
eukprot:CAMPEP_0183789990 /NCGR_PEP_ID=MMETSP0803_2-20130417/748_1 /TAXON_ID=195967 /ORGANISM="Crustomastix stigmata, Strain CCMP3273" /LENGTH=461 /DNA_ID=CAMNT_0026034177 /DNA_START=162 /DNA_END=1547 /DNA_ORIENTATION=+